VGLVLSAGSLRATAHVGTISVLENAGFPIDVVAGTSMGAILGALYAAGHPVARIWEIASSIKFSTGSNLNTTSLIALILAEKLLSSQNLETLLRQKIGNRRFEELPKPFACVAMDLYSGEAIVFREGELAPAVRASMNLPGMFSPIEYRHRYLVDGGVVDYIPVDAAKLLGAQWVLASIAELDYTHSKPKNVLQSLEQVIDIRGSLLSREQRKHADFLIEHPVGDIGIYEFQRIPEAMKKGVIATNKSLKGAMESLILYSLKGLLSDSLPAIGEPRP
jgi:NTE family protein